MFINIKLYSFKLPNYLKKNTEGRERDFSGVNDLSFWSRELGIYYFVVRRKSRFLWTVIFQNYFHEMKIKVYLIWFVVNRDCP